MKKITAFLTYLSNLFSAPSLAAGRNVLMSLAGVAGALGLLSATKAQALIDSIMAVGTAAGVLVAAISGFLVVAIPIISGFVSRQSHQTKNVSLQPNTIVVQTSSPAATAKVADLIATTPEVKQVIASPAIANATASDKVVAAADAKPITA
jgi:hypothetical protein